MKKELNLLENDVGKIFAYRIIENYQLFLKTFEKITRCKS